MVYNKKGVKRRDDEENDERKIKMMKKNRLDDVGSVEKGKKDKNDKNAPFNPDIINICRLSLLLILSIVLRCFSPGAQVFPSPQKPTFPNSNSTKNSRRRTTLRMSYL